MREGRLWLGLIGGLALVFVWALSADDVPNEAALVRVGPGGGSGLQLQAASIRSVVPAAPAPAASVVPGVAEVPVCDAAAAGSNPTDAIDAKVLQDVDAALAARASERAEAVRFFVAGIGANLDGGAFGAHAIDGLALMAVRTLDPAIYAIAYQACMKNRDGACQMISARQWARLDPLNAMPWLHVATEAAAERNDAGVAEAMYQVSRSTHSDAYESTLMREVLTALPKDLKPQLHGALALRLIGVEAAWVLPTGTAQNHCSNLNTRDANRRQLCSDVAETLLRRSNSFIEQSVGINVGRRSGWAPERVEAALMERDALIQVLRQQVVPVASNEDTNACELGVAGIQALRRLAERGEVGSAREALRRSGKSVAEWAAAYRTAIERAKQKAAAPGRAAAASAVMPPTGG